MTFKGLRSISLSIGTKIHLTYQNTTKTLQIFFQKIESYDVLKFGLTFFSTLSQVMVKGFKRNLVAGVQSRLSNTRTF